MASQNQFSPWDYVVFAAVLVISASIGIFYGCYKSRHKNTTEEFLLASREMTILPVTLSSLATFVSAITILGVTSDVYVYGTQYLVLFISFIIMVPLSAHLFFPIFYNLNITSVFEYLELRWKSKGLRILCAILYIISYCIYLSFALISPTLALNAVTGFNLWILVLSVGAVCIFYTSLGGMKAVIWTDVFQILIMLAGLLAIIIQGSIDFGGFANIWEISKQGGRLQFFDFDPNPFRRHTVWTVSIGGVFVWTSLYGISQQQLQRGMSTPSLKQAQIAMWLNLPGLTAILFLTGMCGLVVYAQYKDCDPLSMKVIDRRDQLLPLYMMDALALEKPGLPGLMVASLFSGALSSISSVINALSAITIKDFVRYLWFPKMKEKTATMVSKLLSVGYGVVMIALTVIAANMDGVLTGAITILGMLNGPILGLFSLGILYPCANYKGAYAGFLTSLLITMWVGIGANVYRPGAPKLPVSTAGCYIGNRSEMTLSPTVQNNISASFIEMTTQTENQQKGGYLTFYELSYLYYTAFAVIVCHVVGLLVSFITGGEDREHLDPKLISPVFDIFCCYLPKSVRQKCWCDVPHDKKEDK